MSIRTEMKKKMPQSEIKKMKQGMSYSCKEKTIILNVFKFFCNEHPDKCVTELVRKTAKATGCSEKSIFQFRKEEASAEGFKQPSRTKIRKNININSRDIKYGDTVRQAIRNVIYDLRYKNIVPSLNAILKQIKENSSIPNFSLMTLRRLLFDMGFTYEKNGTKFILIEKDSKKSLNANINHNNINQNENKPIQQCNNIPNNVPVVVDNNLKPNPPLPLQNSLNVPMPQVNNLHVMDQQPNRLLVHINQHEQPPMPQMHHPHNMSVMMNHTPMPMQPHPTHHDYRLPPPSFDMHMKRDMFPWVHHQMTPQNVKVD